jgi:hypothetical protein
MLAEVVVELINLIHLVKVVKVVAVVEEAHLVHQVQVLLRVARALPIEAVEVAVALTLVQEMVALVVKV